MQSQSTQVNIGHAFVTPTRNDRLAVRFASALVVRSVYQSSELLRTRLRRTPYPLPSASMRVACSQPCNRLDSNLPSGCNVDPRTRRSAPLKYRHHPYQNRCRTYRRPDNALWAFAAEPSLQVPLTSSLPSDSTCTAFARIEPTDVRVGQHFAITIKRRVEAPIIEIPRQTNAAVLRRNGVAVVTPTSNNQLPVGLQGCGLDLIPRRRREIGGHDATSARKLCRWCRSRSGASNKTGSSWAPWSTGGYRRR